MFPCKFVRAMMCTSPLLDDASRVWANQIRAPYQCSNGWCDWIDGGGKIVLKHTRRPLVCKVSLDITKKNEIRAEATYLRFLCLAARSSNSTFTHLIPWTSRSFSINMVLRNGSIRQTTALFQKSINSSRPISAFPAHMVPFLRSLKPRIAGQLSHELMSWSNLVVKSNLFPSDPQFLFDGKSLHPFDPGVIYRSRIGDASKRHRNMVLTDVLVARLVAARAPGRIFQWGMCSASCTSGCVWPDVARLASMSTQRLLQFNESASASCGKCQSPAKSYYCLPHLDFVHEKPAIGGRRNSKPRMLDLAQNKQ